MKQTNEKDTLYIEVANRIWDICKISSEHGNTVMDIIGYEAYERVMRLQSRSQRANALINKLKEFSEYVNDRDLFTIVNKNTFTQTMYELFDYNKFYNEIISIYVEFTIEKIKDGNNGLISTPMYVLSMDSFYRAIIVKLSAEYSAVNFDKITKFVIASTVLFELAAFLSIPISSEFINGINGVINNSASCCYTIEIITDELEKIIYD